MALFRVKGRVVYEVSSEIEAEDENEARTKWNNMQDVDFYGENLVDWDIDSIKKMAEEDDD